MNLRWVVVAGNGMVPSRRRPAEGDAFSDDVVATLSILIITVERLAILAVTSDYQQVFDLLGIVLLRLTETEDRGLECVRTVNCLGFTGGRVVWPFGEVWFPTAASIVSA